MKHLCIRILFLVVVVSVCISPAVASLKPLKPRVGLKLDGKGPSVRSIRDFKVEARPGSAAK